ncbi:MAG: DUF763 domain-containing protein [Crenarchaeota archaeon]|nr:DUF763 domain-containing protein [Thermoproteota archaeon]
MRSSDIGVADLPLHDGRVPPYLMARMRRLGIAIARVIVEEFGPRELVYRVADPLWLQAYSNVIGMDWDSSGATTVAIYVLKSFAPPRALGELGIAFLGGKGSDSLKVPIEAREASESCRGCIDAPSLSTISRLSAKIDSALLQDGYELYIHALAVAEDGSWTIIQQGMNTDTRMARRYHIAGRKSEPSVERDPHAAIACNRSWIALNLVDEESYAIRRSILDLVKDSAAERIVRYVAELNRAKSRARSLESWIRGSREMHIDKNLLRFYRPIRDYGRLRRIFNQIRELAPSSFRDLVLVRGLGKDTIAALALVAHLIYGFRPSLRDPVTHALDPLLYAYAHGGKDGYPYPVNIKRLEETASIIEQAIDSSRLDSMEKKRALRRLSAFVDRVARRALQSSKSMRQPF